MSDKTRYPGCAMGRLLSAPRHTVCQWGMTHCVSVGLTHCVSVGDDTPCVSGGWHTVCQWGMTHCQWGMTHCVSVGDDKPGASGGWHTVCQWGMTNRGLVGDDTPCVSGGWQTGGQWGMTHMGGMAGKGKVKNVFLHSITVTWRHCTKRSSLSRYYPLLSHLSGEIFIHN